MRIISLGVIHYRGKKLGLILSNGPPYKRFLECYNPQYIAVEVHQV
jgi:hypothetical protein